MGAQDEINVMRLLDQAEAAVSGYDAIDLYGELVILGSDNFRHPVVHFAQK
jgi:hypothetical protein